MLEKTPDSILNVSEHIGDFIEYWGFKKIHGKVWTLIFLSEQPVDANYLINNLGVSKALISMTLSDLLKYNVILEVEKKSTQQYVSNNNLIQVIMDVLLHREAKMLLNIKSSIEILNRLDNDRIEPYADPRKIKQLSKMVNTADLFLKSLLAFKNINVKDFAKALILPNGKSNDKPI